MLHAFPEQAKWLWQEFSSADIQHIVKFTAELNKKSLEKGNKYPEIEDKIIDVTDPDIKSQLDKAKAKLNRLS